VSDLACAVAIVSLVAVVGVIYGGRWLLRGRVRFRRVEQDGGSALLGKGVMDAGYWSLQPIGRALVALGIPANAVTGASLAFGVGAGVAVGLGRLGLGAILSTAAGLCDSLDGLVARASGASSDSGEMLDAAIDRLVESAFLVGLAVHYRDRPVVFALVLLALVGSFMVSYTSARAEALHVPAPRGAMRRAERAVYLAMGAGFSPIFDALSKRLPEAFRVAQLPMVVAIAMVAVIANASVISRVRQIERSLAQQDIIDDASRRDVHG
jgi:CDP-diacylglycerol--glycerol-3-phosphate 3-phosphatidyltransferase